MTRAVLALGSNLGDQEANLRKALDGLAEHLVKVSGSYWTPPWGDPDQPEYLNAVVLVDGDEISADGWLELAHELEEAGGRVRDPERQFGPRTLDVDVIAVWDGNEQIVQNNPDLTLPHARAHLRAFVLVPLSEIAPDVVLAGHGSIAELLKTEAVSADVPTVRSGGSLEGPTLTDQ
ncbi:2-amino-4-hydroxy-6-hydroxymethyldihydropteridine diphosphokinase [Kribbella qitaiheensis]|uniref:2-amino-4-hydroxy-6-hydroxymethyldihydropteridine diphosphokinase n=1 Tax=Kribbella qitaiheensis TaxID=1544730 RepID=A0A7G6X1I4_9ACTN|nr:2-amino-4-hydroxy-6-hydroxymethyldihydropteridine diphosphokinase [Kribbella qitaiheensis]QNE20099.1 2-amino-4-hydroxy-6-hydroxymethyldihydropteridine diphosphokinase [Kribbella qitaiheensis]